MSLNKLTIAALHPNAINFITTGTIINKSNMRAFEKKGQSTLSAVIKFVLRDTSDHFINVTVWGNVLFIEECNSQFTIGHVVNVVKSKISPVSATDNYSPFTSSLFQLTVNEGFGSIEFYDGDITEFVKLLTVPLKSPDLALNLSDIASVRSASDTGDLVDLFVVVAKMKPIRQIKEKYLVRDVVVVDQTVPGMHLTIWNEHWINRSESWNEMSTILHLINVNFKYSEYHKSIALVTQSRTMIIVDPVGERSTSLLHYTKNSLIRLMDFDTSEPDLSTITTVMSIQKIIDRIEDDSSDSVFYALTYAMITQMDIDGWTKFYSRRCTHCSYPIKVKDTGCNKENCSIIFAESPLDVHYIDYYNIPLHLTDHTGTLLQCRLKGDNAERILGHSLSDFLKLSDAERSSIKWKFLMERCSIKLSIKRKSALRWNTQLTILDCQVANPGEVIENIKVY